MWSVRIAGARLGHGMLWRSRKKLTYFNLVGRILRKAETRKSQRPTEMLLAREETVRRENQCAEVGEVKRGVEGAHKT